MHNFKFLFKGEMQRLIKYKILQISVVVTGLWLFILFLIGANEAPNFVPLFIFMDVSMMTVLLVGANLFFEKQENTLKTLLMTPSGFMALMASKFISSIYVALQSSVMIAVFAYFIFDVQVLFLWLFVFVILIALFHTALGFAMTVFVNDFNNLLVLYMAYMIVFAFPTLFFELGLLGDVWEFALMFSPSHASLLMIRVVFNHDTNVWLVIIGVIYLIVASFALLKWIVFPKYVETAVKE